MLKCFTIGICNSRPYPFPPQPLSEITSASSYIRQLQYQTRACKSHLCHYATCNNRKQPRLCGASELITNTTMRCRKVRTSFTEKPPAEIRHLVLNATILRAKRYVAKDEEQAKRGDCIGTMSMQPGGQVRHPCQRVPCMVYTDSTIGATTRYE